MKMNGVHRARDEMASASLGCLLAVIVCASGSCLPRDETVMDREFFESVEWKPMIVHNGTHIEKVLLNYSWKKKTDIDYSGVLYRIIKDRRDSPPLRRKAKKSLSEAEKLICTSGINDYREKQLAFDDFQLFCFRECAEWCDGTFCSDVSGQHQLEDKNVLRITIEADWGVEYHLLLEGYYNFSVSRTTSSNSAAAVFCLDEMIVNKQMNRSQAEDICRGTAHFGKVFRIGPPFNLSLVNVFYDYQKTVAIATFTWEYPLDIAKNANVSWFLADTEYPPICDGEDELKKIMATEGKQIHQIELSFGERGIFYVVACCDFCTAETKTGFPSEFNFRIEDIDVCNSEYGVPYCDHNSLCFFANSKNSTPTCSCFQGYAGNGVRKTYDGTGCHISCSNRNTLNHTCTSNAYCEDDENGDALCFCPRFSFGDGQRRGSGCTSMISAIFVPVLVVLVACFALIFLLKRRRRHMEDKIRMSKFIEKRATGDKNEYPGAKMDCGTFGHWEINRNDVTLHGVLGRGISGVVHKATLRNKSEEMTVAVKTVSECQAENFLGEISLITTIGRHDNVLTAIGCCTSGYPLLLITEFMQYGDLQHFLWDSREPTKAESDQIYKLREADVYEIGRQVASGMTHLSRLKIIHGDLAARNILVGKGLHCKISDFGLANDVYRYGMIKCAMEKRVPFKWISPERMMRGKVPITWRSDVWSCGVLLYETVTLGGEPYPGVKQEDLLTKLSAGYRMERPSSCGETLFQIMSRCWEWTPSKRPSFRELESLLTSPKDKHIYINLLEEDANEKLMKS